MTKKRKMQNTARSHLDMLGEGRPPCRLLVLGLHNGRLVGADGLPRRPAAEGKVGHIRTLCDF